MTWSAVGFESAFEALCRQFAQATFPEPPPGFTALSSPRPMRVVLRGAVPTAEGAREVVVKWHQPRRPDDHVSRRVRGGKATREGKVLRALAAGDVRVPTALAYGDEPDLLVSAFESDLRPLTHPPDRATLLAVAEQLGRALRAGLDARDLSPENVAATGAGAMLVDLGSAAIRNTPDVVEMLGRWRYAFGQHLGYTDRWRALHAVLRAAGRSPREARKLARPVEAAAHRIAARHRRGRDRRARRDGRHFEMTTQGVRRNAWTGPALHEAAALLALTDADAPRLKDDGSVRRVERAGVTFVVKTYAAPESVKLPRPPRAFRRAFALENRHVPAARAHLAYVASDGSGLLLSDWIPGPNLHAWIHDEGSEGYAALAPARRRAVLRALGRMLRAMHDEGIVHRDLKAPNLVWHDDGTPGGRCTIVDVDGARVVRGRVPWKRRARDLARLAASVPASRADRLRVLRAYRDVWPVPRVDERTMAGWIDAHVRRKRGPSGQPR